MNEKRVRRLLRQMSIEAIYPKPKLRRPEDGRPIYPYRLRGAKIERVNQVWSAGITCIPMARGFACLVAVMDWFRR